MNRNLSNEHYECCLRCQSRRIVVGKLTPEQGFLPIVFRCFRPIGFWFKLAYNTGLGGKILIPVLGESFLCLDCGTIWTTIDPKIGESVIHARAGEALKRSLGLLEKTKTTSDDLA